MSPADAACEPSSGAARRIAPAGISVAAVGVLYGYDLSTFAGALRDLTAEFGLSTRQQQMVTAAVVIGEVAGAVGGVRLADTIGRKRATVLATAGYAAFAAISAAAVSLPLLLVARLLVGLAIGVSLTVVPVFLAECAPARVRGALLVASQLTTTVGIIAGYLAASLLAGSHSWRWSLGLAAVPALLILPALLPIPDTARWYLLTGRPALARRALAVLDPAADIEAGLAEISLALAEERGGGCAEMLRPPTRRATVFVLGLGFVAHLTGINAIIYYSTQLFGALGFTGNAALLALPALIQVAGLAAAGAALLLVDRVGRRPILLSGAATIVTADVVVAGAFVAGAAALGAFGVLLFVAGFSVGFGAIVGVYAGECFPARLRAAGVGGDAHR